MRSTAGRQEKWETAAGLAGTAQVETISQRMRSLRGETCLERWKHIAATAIISGVAGLNIPWKLRNILQHITVLSCVVRQPVWASVSDLFSPCCSPWSGLAVICPVLASEGAVTAADDSRAELSVVVRSRQCQHLPSLRHGDMSLSSDSEASNSSISDPRFGSQTVAPDSPTPYTDAIKVNIKRPQHFISTGPNS